ncbi:MAG TPA: hypothetical protein VFX59_06840 [Polyangiales bacterium]|nr:hypothetical protein [Polyangiales bacterium]
MRRTSTGLVPSLCSPDASKPTTAALTKEVLDEQQRIVAFESPEALSVVAATPRTPAAIGVGAPLSYRSGTANGTAWLHAF